MQTVTLKTAPEVKRLVNAILPSYKKHNVFLSEFHSLSVNSYWDDGSKSTFILVNLQDMTTQPLPSSTHPYFDVVRQGIQGESEWVSVDGRGNITLKVLPEGFAVIECGTFCGKTATAHVFLNAANMSKLLGEGVGR